MEKEVLKKIEMYSNIARFRQKAVDNFIAKELGISDDNISYSAITEEETKRIVDKLIKMKNEGMEKGLTKELEKLYEKQNFWKKKIVYKNKDNFIQYHKSRILKMEQVIFDKYNLEWFDREFKSDYARHLVYKELYDLRDTIGDITVEYSNILTEMYGSSHFPRKVYESLALRCKSAHLDREKVFESMRNHQEEQNKVHQSFIESARNSLLIKKKAKENEINFF